MKSYYRTPYYKKRQRARARQLYEEKREEKIAYSREYFLANEERVREYRKTWRKVNAREIADKKAAWRKANPDAMRAWRMANPDASRRHHAARKARQHTLPSERVDLDLVRERSDNRCWLCRIPVEANATVDHLIPLAADLHELAKWGVEHPGHVTANLELACRSCNSRKFTQILPCAVARYLRNARTN